MCLTGGGAPRSKKNSTKKHIKKHRLKAFTEKTIRILSITSNKLK